MTRYCTNCGAELDEKATFCSNCGAKQNLQTEKVHENKVDDEPQRKSVDQTNNQWKPYNQFTKDQYTKSTLIATRDTFKFDRCVGKSNFWFAYLYLFIVQVIVLFVAASFAVPVAIVADLLTLSLLWRRANDGVSNNGLKIILIIAYAFTIIGDVMVAVEIPCSIIQLAILLYIGLQKTDWSTKFDRPVE